MMEKRGEEAHDLEIVPDQSASPSIHWTQDEPLSPRGLRLRMSVVSEREASASASPWTPEESLSAGMPVSDWLSDEETLLHRRGVEKK